MRPKELFDSSSLFHLIPISFLQYEALLAAQNTTVDFKINWITDVIVLTLFVFFSEYYQPTKMVKSGSQRKTCSYNDYPDSRLNEVCEVDPRDWGECNKEQYFNYHKNSPCVFIKLNRIYGWVPEYYNNPYDLPVDMPRELKQHIMSINNTLEVSFHFSSWWIPINARWFIIEVISYVQIECTLQKGTYTCFIIPM